MKKLCLTVWLIAISLLCFAGIDDFYSFNATTGTFTPITGTAITDILNDDQISTALPIGFTFPYGDVNFTEIKASSNGWIGLGTTLDNSNLSNDLPSTTFLPVLAPLWDDCSLAGGTATYTTSGTAPNRIFTIEYAGMKWNYSADNSLSLQIRLYETGKIDFIYGTMTGDPANASASIGINMAPGGAGWYYSVTPGTPSTASSTAHNSSISTYPGAGTVFEFIPAVTQTNDLAALSITGNTTPSVGAASVYTVTIRNRGTSAQSNYTVKLVTATGTELASVNGTPLAAGAIQAFPISWTPTTEGPLSLKGKVVLAGDQNTTNDLTQPYPITVMPQGLAVITVGDGSEQSRVPVDMYWKNSLFETLYYPAEISMFGTISALAFYNNFVSDLPNKPTKIWLGTTNNADLSAGWIPSTQLTQVFDGNVNYPTGQNVVMIPLQTPFTYSGGNLVMMVNRPMDTIYFSSSDNFAAQTIGTNRALRMQSDSTEFLPENPQEGATLSGQFPKTSFYISPLSPDPVVMVNPNPLSFGQILMNQTSTRGITILNGGGGTATISQVSLSGSPFFTISNPPTLPANLTTGQNIALNILYAPTAAGDHTATLTVVDNTTRLTHTVSITGNSMDPTIYALPYQQNFDTATVPNLPLAWGKIVTPAGSSAYVNVQNSTVFSTPNAVAMYNGNEAEAQLLLIAPPLAPALSVTGSRVNFRARSTSMDQNLLVGILSNPQDAATFTQIASIALTNTWTEYLVSFAGYTGTGRYLAFKHGATNTWVNMFIDNVMLEVIPQNDLAALQITGNATPSVNAATIYNVSVINRGSLSQSTYQVKLFNALNDAELASAPGLTVAPDATVTVPVSWTPLVEGAIQIYAKVVLTGDQNALNDATAPIDINVFPTGIIAVTIGTGDQNALIPVDMYWKNSLFQTMYYPTEMTAFGNINSITFYNTFQTNLPNKPVKIWLGSTMQADLTAGWIPASQMTLVFDGNVNFPNGANTIVIPLQTPFTYAGGNLTMMVNRPMDTQYFSSADTFLSQTVGTARSRKVYSDTTLFDPMAPPTESILGGQFPKTTFHMSPLSPDPVFHVNPDSRNFGTVLLNSTHNQIFSVMNMGGGNLGVNTISISGSPFFTLQNMPTLPATLGTGQTVSFTVRYNPTAVGTHNATVTITDNQGRLRSISVSNSREAHNVQVSGTCIDPTILTLPYQQLFDEVTIPDLPVQWSKIIQSTSNNAQVLTVTNDPFSAPNSVVLGNVDDASATLILVAPPYSTAIQTNTTRAKFQARSSSNGYTLEMGVLANPQDPATFTLIQTLSLTNEWSEYIVSFGAYTGAGKNIAFRHGMGGTYRNIFIDNVVLEVNPQNDLAAISIQGNSTPTLGVASTYTVNIFNWGINPQSTYQVKLYKQDNTEIASVNGTLINTGQTLPVSVAWTPDAEGNATIYAKVILANDQNPQNDQTSSITVTVQPPGMFAFTIGDGSSTGRIPVDMYYMNSLFETMYYPAEMGNNLGMIYGIGFYNNFATDLQNMPTNIWLGTTTEADLSAGWIPSTQLTQVFSGTVNYPSGQNLIHITFPEPYMYLDGGNLVLMVQRPMDTGYYSSQDLFLAQTVGETRARNVYSDGTPYDPADPSGGTLSGLFPKTTIFMIPGGVGHINGTVLGAGNQPLSDVAVQFTTGGYNTTTNASGQYSIINIIDGDYSVNFSKYGYISQNHNITIPEDETVVLNVTLQEMPQVNVTGTIVASDTGNGLSGASIHLVGYQDYTANTIGTGAFTIPSVYANQTYEYTIMAPGYTNITGTINVGGANHNMGTLTLNEIAYAPHNVVADLNESFSSVNLDWLAPDPTAVEIVEGFESTNFPPTDWTQIITNTGEINTSGVYPTWCKFGSVTMSGTPVNPTEGSYQCGLWWDYEHQDEWLKTPAFNCPPDAYITLDSYVFLGSENGDHYYIKVSTDNGNTWTPIWDASAQTGGWNYYASPITVDLSAYSGMQIQLAIHAEDPPTNDGMWYVWFMDNIYIGNAIDTVRFLATADAKQADASRNASQRSKATTKPSRQQEMGDLRNEPALPRPQEIRAITTIDRTLTGYKVWRLTSGQEGNEAGWISLTENPIANLHLEDPAWSSLANGSYRWAVKAIYTAGVASAPSLSNTMVKENVTGNIVGFVRRSNNQGIAGATVVAGTYSTVTNNAGAYSLTLPVGLYDVTATATGFHPRTIDDILVSPNQNTTLNIVMTSVANEDEISPVTATALKGNMPNPFNPETTIQYDILEPCQVSLEIYNLKGQKIRTLINETKKTGRYGVVFDSKDDNGNPIASGVYFYRFSAGKYTATKKMLLME